LLSSKAIEGAVSHLHEANKRLHTYNYAHELYKQESRAAARKPRDAASVLFR